MILFLKVFRRPRTTSIQLDDYSRDAKSRRTLLFFLDVGFQREEGRPDYGNRAVNELKDVDNEMLVIDIG